MNEHLFINETTGQPVKFGSFRPRFLPVVDYFADCDNCEQPIMREKRGTLTGVQVMRFICKCACIVELENVI